MTTSTPSKWIDLDLSIKVGELGYVDPAIVDKLAGIAQEALKTQVESVRLVIARSYLVLGYVINLAVISAGGVGVASQAVTKASGWLVNPSIVAGFLTALLVLFVAAVLVLANVWPRGLSLPAVYIDDFHDLHYLTDDTRKLQLAIIKLCRDSMEANAARTPPYRKRLRVAVACVLASPFAGLAAWGVLTFGTYKLTITLS